MVNGVASAIVERILLAASRGEAFRVVVVLPLLPAFPGDVQSPAAASLRQVGACMYTCTTLSVCMGGMARPHAAALLCQVDSYKCIYVYACRYM